MIKKAVWVEIETRYEGFTLELRMFNPFDVLLVYKDRFRIEGGRSTPSWSDLWNCLFLPKGQSKKFKFLNLESITHLNNSNEESYLELVYCKTGNQAGTHQQKLVIRWKDLFAGLLAIKRKIV